MNILLFLMLVIAVFLYGSELLETSKSETSLATRPVLLHAGQIDGAKGRDDSLDSLSASGAQGAASSAAVPGEEPEESPKAAERRSQGPGLSVFDFYGEEPAWRIVNDTVMGGISRSMVEVDAEQRRLIFSGTVSLDNNGGFASTRSEWAAYDLRMFDGLALRVRGDGNVYRLRIRTAETGPNIAYTALFPTDKGEWQEVYVPFSSMVPLYRGFVVSDAGPLEPASIRSFGLMVADKQEGPFALEVDWIHAVAERETEVKLISYMDEVK